MRFFPSLELRNWEGPVVARYLAIAVDDDPKTQISEQISGRYRLQISPKYRPGVGTGRDRDLRRGWILTLANSSPEAA